MSITEFIEAHAADDVRQLALQRQRFPALNNEQWLFCLQQIDGRQRMQRKLPQLCQTPGFTFAPHLNLEQCSSEATATYKAQLIQSLDIDTVVDLTGGFGIDSLYMSKIAKQVHYVEQDGTLCRIMQHNTNCLNANVTAHHSTAENILSDHSFWQSLTPEKTLIYADPARRNTEGKKVFLLSDCQPDIVSLMPLIQQRAKHWLLKLSPMLDPVLAIRELNTDAITHIVAVADEVKEMLLQKANNATCDTVIVSDLTTSFSFAFTRREEQQAQCLYADRVKTYLYEPSAAMLKAGAHKRISEHWHLEKLDPNTQLYTSDTLIADFPGKVFITTEQKPQKGAKMNVLCRNYPLTAKQLQHKLHITDGTDNYLIGFRLKGKPQLVVANRIFSKNLQH